MTVQVAALFEAVQIPASNSTLYTSPANTKSIIDKLTVSNPTAGALTFSLFLVPAAGAAGAGNQIISTKSIAANDSYLCPEAVGHTLEPGDTIVAIASAATSLVARGSGRKVS